MKKSEIKPLARDNTTTTEYNSGEVTRMMKIKDENRIRVSTAAKLRGVRRQAIYWHVSEGNLNSMEIDGNLYVDKLEVLSWEPKKAGEYRPRKK